MLVRRPFKVFSRDDSLTWKIMFERQWPQIQKYGSHLYLEGMEKLKLPSDHIPDFEQLNQRFKELIGWELVSTNVQYSGDQEWFEALNRREFLITEYIRDRQDINYTPLPDIFHDAFGHLPLMVSNQPYADYIQRFGAHVLHYTPEERKSLSSLWWYTVEFGLIREKGELKALGAGLMSSYEELQRVFIGQVELVPYNWEAFETTSQSPHAVHQKLFVLESFDQFEHAVLDWVEHHPK